LKQNNWVCSRIKWLVIAVWLWLALSAVSAPAYAQIKVMREASMSVDVASGAVRIEHQTLPLKWDHYLPGQNGRVSYTLQLPPRSSFPAHGAEDLFALYVPRVGNQVQVLLNGQLIASQGALDDTQRDNSESPLYVAIPVNLVNMTESTPLVIRTSVQALRFGGLSEVYFGLDRELCHTYDWARLWQKTSYVVIVVSLMLMGLLSLLIWLRQRKYEAAKLYLYFVWSAIAGSIAALDHLLVQHYLPWPVQGIVAAVALAWHVIFMSRFALEVVDRQEKWVSLSMLASTLAIGIAYVLAEPVYWTLMLGLLCLPLAAALICTAKAADTQRSGPARLLFAVSLIAALAGLRDFFFVQWPSSGMSHFVMLPQALFLFVLVMGGILVKRYTEQHRLYHELNVSLEERVSERERELARSFDTIKVQGEERAKLLERQRIMSDIHDGVGGQLVGLLNMIKRSRIHQDQQTTLFGQAQLEEHAQMALDELRVAVDAMQPVEGDLATVLATLRYRLEPRLKASDIALVWQVDELPLMLDLTPQKVLQIQKILLEALTNVMRHAQATQVALQAKATEEGIDIAIIDDGVGFDESALAVDRRAQGHGLSNMRFRAEAIGAKLIILRGARGLPQGTTLTLHIPV
jgi:signal transduction histidine kinase